MLKFVIGLIAGLVILPLGVWAYFRLGYAPVATNAAPMPFEKQFAHMALHAKINKEASKDSPVAANEEAYAAGAALYRTHCAVCHGLPGAQKTAIAKGMFPKVPQLFKGHGVTDDPVGHTYWLVANGIRLSGMPAFSDALSDKQMWQISQMLANADKLSPQVNSILQQPLSLQ